MGVFGKLTSKGQTTVPTEIRNILGVKAGDHIEYVTETDGTITLRKAQHGLENLRGIIKLGFPVTSADIDEWCRDVRENGWRRE